MKRKEMCDPNKYIANMIYSASYDALIKVPIIQLMEFFDYTSNFRILAMFYDMQQFNYRNSEKIKDFLLMNDIIHHSVVSEQAKRLYVFLEQRLYFRNKHIE